jgi:hypothetical protein
MAEKPTRAADYSPEQLERVRATCLYVATKLSDLMEDVVVVGGLVPSLLIPQDQLPAGVSPHVGTMDLDLGLKFAVIDEQRYREISERLRRAGFEPDVTDEGKITRQRWRISEPAVTVDFLIETEDAVKRAGKLMNIESDFAAIIAPGLHLAFRDREQVNLKGETIAGEKAERAVWVCGPGAFVVLKSLGFRFRGENKDAHDLFYVIRNYGNGVADVATRLKPLLNDDAARRAIEYLQQDFVDRDATGPRRAAEFEFGRSDDAMQADVVGFVRQLLELCRG